LRRRYFWGGWIVAVVLLIALLIFPLRTTLTRLAIIALSGISWFGLLIQTWRRSSLRVTLIAITVLLTTFILLPSRSPIEPEQLREIYVNQLRKFDNTPYVYGGENRIGIDCSGLVRAGMFQALRIYGIKAFNSAALRCSLHLWWADCNAIDLGKGRTGDTIPINNGEFSKLSDHRMILPGDLAVTESGSHVLAYLGNETWIEAEPSVGRTHVFELTGQFAPLADERVRFVRWRWLAKTEQ
jgi:hypothetical protein